MNTPWLAGLCLSLSLSLAPSGPAWATDEADFNTEFSYQQGPHPKARGRLKEGYRIHSFFSFDLDRAPPADWRALGAGYLRQVRPGMIGLDSTADTGPYQVQAAAPLPCDVRYIFSRAKEVEAKGRKQGFAQLSSPERSIYNFSKKYIKDSEQIRFRRQLRQGADLPWQDIASRFGLSGQPLWVLEERLSDFNQFAIEGRVRTVLLAGAGDRLRVVGEIDLTLDADILDKRVIGLMLSVPLKAALKGLLPTQAVFGRVADRLKAVEADSRFQCEEDEANAASLIYGVPNFVHSYLASLKEYLGTEDRRQGTEDGGQRAEDR
ncbi:hypothetical protein [gamma proteobacterium SS-5]|uniref:hypothetical protein n=1 Tax=Magnetovirga frankeli TaxID=947516 RepID=UPI00129303AF